MYHVCDKLSFFNIAVSQSVSDCIYHEWGRNIIFFSIFISFKSRNQVCQNMRLYETKRKERIYRVVFEYWLTCLKYNKREMSASIDRIQPSNWCYSFLHQRIRSLPSIQINPYKICLKIKVLNWIDRNVAITIFNLPWLNVLAIFIE